MSNMFDPKDLVSHALSTTVIAKALEDATKGPSTSTKFNGEAARKVAEAVTARLGPKADEDPVLRAQEDAVIKPPLPKRDNILVGALAAKNLRVPPRP